MSDTKISIIIPCYNAEKWIELCVMSALSQDYKNKEVVAIDNESIDSTFDILKKIKDKHPELILGSAKNIYPNCWDEARFKGFEIATGKYFFTLASDDFIKEDYVSKYMDNIASIRDSGKFLVFQSPIVGIKGENIEEVVNFIGYKYKTLQEFKEYSLQRCPVVSPTVVFDRELYDSGVLVTSPEKYGGAADYDLYCNLADKNIFIYPIETWLGYIYRWHPEQATWNVQKEGVGYDSMIQDYWGEKWKQ